MNGPRRGAIESKGLRIPTSESEGTAEQKPKSKPPRKQRKVVLPLSKKEAQRLINSAPKGRDLRVVTVMLMTGMHPAVISRNDDYRLEWAREGLLTWLRPKTGNLCSWRVKKKLIPTVDRFLKEDLGLSTRTYSNIVRRAARKAGLKHVSALTLRHTAAVLRLMDGETPGQVQEALQISERILWGHYGKVKAGEAGGRG